MKFFYIISINIYVYVELLRLYMHNLRNYYVRACVRARIRVDKKQVKCWQT